MLPPPSKIPPRWRYVLSKRTSREQALAQWRSLTLETEERALGRKVRSAGDVLPKVLSAFGMDRKLSDAEILKSWNHLVDPNIAAHAQPTGFRHGTLFVSVDSNVWLDEIVRYRRKEILDRLHNAFGRDLIKKISFRSG